MACSARAQQHSAWPRCDSPDRGGVDLKVVGGGREAEFGVLVAMSRVGNAVVDVVHLRRRPSNARQHQHERSWVVLGGVWFVTQLEAEFEDFFTDFHT